MADKHNMFIQALGRYVSGDTMKKREKDNRGVAIAPDKQRIEFGVAVPKTDPDLPRVFGEIATFCNTIWAGDQYKLQAFNEWYGGNFDKLSMKISDGDKPNKKGQYNENTKGCYVFWFSSGYPPKASNTAMQEIDLASIKRGDYVHMSLSIADNKLPVGDGAGIYMNPAIMMLVYEGDAITGGVDAATAFAGMQVSTAMPAGARPLGSAMGAPGGVPGQPPAGMPGTAPQQPPQGMPGQAQGNPPQQYQQPPAGMPGQHAQGHAATGHAPMQTPPGVPHGAPPTTAYPGSQPGQVQQYQQPPAGMPGQAPGAPQGQVQQQQMPNPHQTILHGPGAAPQGMPGQ